MKNIRLILLICVLGVSPSIAQAKWYNPISWFTKHSDGGKATIKGLQQGALQQGQDQKSGSSQSMEQSNSVKVTTDSRNSVKIDSEAALTIAAPTNAVPTTTNAVPTTVEFVGHTHDNQNMGYGYLTFQKVKDGLNFYLLFLIGLAVFLFGCVSFAYPSLRLIEGKASPTWICLSGVGMMVAYACLQSISPVVYAIAGVIFIGGLIAHYVFHVSITKASLEATLAAVLPQSAPVQTAPVATALNTIAPKVATAPPTQK